MALITCPECKSRVSTTALSCPKCGYLLTAADKVKTESSWLKGCLSIFAILFLLSLIGRACDSGTQNEKSNYNQSSNNSVQNSKPIEKKPSNNIKLNYTIKYSATIRADGGMSYFVLIPRCNLSTPNFKEDIKAMIDEITNNYGGNISIDFIDDSWALEKFYAHYGPFDDVPSLTTKERKSFERHQIAAFSGQLSSHYFYNTLTYFPSAFESTPKVGKYVDIVEYNPVKQ